MHCQKTFGIVRETGNHLLVQLKAKQFSLFDAIRDIAANGPPPDTAASRNNGRSRQEGRLLLGRGGERGDEGPGDVARRR